MSAPPKPAPVAAHPIVLELTTDAYVAVKEELVKVSEADIAAASFVKRPLVRFGWSIVFMILFRIVAYLVERLLDNIAANPLDVLAALFLRRREEIAARPRGATRPL